MSDKILYSKPGPVEEAQKIISIFREDGIHLNIYLNDELYMEELTAWGEKYAKDVRVKAHVVNDIEKTMTVDPYKMLGIGNIECIEKMQKYLKNREDIKLDFIRSKPHYLEILARDVSKGNALKKLAETWGIDRSEVMAIGDAPNDVSMLEWAGIGVAVSNASDQVKKSADLLVAENNNNGVAEAINGIL
jgi:Cof subfamily protein (haloacid dehalogenase superfamily)